jgi:hypothetical protein
MRIIIAGTRTFNDYEMFRDNVKDILSDIKTDDIEIISGHARGVDQFGERFAKEFKYKLKIFPADWNARGKSAGYLRNIEMSQYASENKEGMLIAFWDGYSKGTNHMINIAKEYKLDVRIIRYTPLE